MPDNRFRHIFLAGPTSAQGFTNPRKGGSPPRIHGQDRIQHSDYLQQRLQKTWAEFDLMRQRQAVAHVERHGAYIEFVSEPGFDLMIKSLEHQPSGIRLYNVRKDGDGEKEKTFATVYIPHAKRTYFLKKIKAYATETDRRSNKPKNANLINNIADIHLAVLESFWRSNEKHLIPNATPEWLEVWLSSDQKEVVDRFDELLRKLDIEATEDSLIFPERTVKLILANRKNLEQLIEASDDIAEFRLAKEIASFFIQLENREQTALVQDLLGRCNFNDDAGVFVCILDTGVNSGHPLLRPVLDEDDLQTVRPEWGVNDHNGHGTLMAGMAAYGDLMSLLNNKNPVVITHRLESSKILPPPPDENPKKLWGDIIAQGISRAEIQGPKRKRIVCLAVTATDDRDRGHPSSWSGAIDELASGYHDDVFRLILISAGNVDDPVNWRNYPEDNLTNEIHDPGQAWNALTVGAITEKTRIDDPTLRSFNAIAPTGGLSPFSTTSCDWPQRKWPIKPEVVFEGGNVASGPNDSVFDPDDLKLLSTNYHPQESQFAPFWATSAASAQAAWMAAQIQSRYPDAWPETVRALIVHSADWTEAMKRQFLRDPFKKTAYAKFLRIFGYGKPDLEKAMYCASNSLTLISQAALQPYGRQTKEKLDSNGKKKPETRYVTRDMHLYNLPWPVEALIGLGETTVTMRVTLSYFVEPSPGEIGWEDRYRYASHALRFDVNGPGEDEDAFIQRINKQAREDGETPGTEGAGKYWKIGEARNVGSIHSDIWEGRAADLAGSNLIAVYPAVGWWRERKHLNKWDSQCRYSLIVSIYTPEQTVDIYTPVAVKVGVAIPISI
jgi:hypothetical protein